MSEKNLIKLSENNQPSLWFVNSKEIPIDVSFYLLIYLFQHKGQFFSVFDSSGGLGWCEVALVQSGIRSIPHPTSLFQNFTYCTISRCMILYSVKCYGHDMRWDRKFQNQYKKISTKYLYRG